MFCDKCGEPIYTPSNYCHRAKNKNIFHGLHSTYNTWTKDDDLVGKVFASRNDEELFAAGLVLLQYDYYLLPRAGAIRDFLAICGRFITKTWDPEGLTP